LDLVGELPDRNLVHIELQSRNEKDFPLRMAECLFGIWLRFGRLPRQVVLYVGEAPLRMRDRVEAPDVSLHFHLVDIRDLDVLTRLGSQLGGVRRILERIPAGPAGGTRLWPSCLSSPDCGAGSE
jgi:hypothetical protein